jgi:periplasmic divalent cation tolerance protein
MLLIYSTCQSKDEAEKIIKELLKKRLIACGNYWRGDSLYLWEGKIKSSKEFFILMKSLDKNFSEIKRTIKKMHSYKIPCILSWKSDKVESDYLKWVEEALF